MGWLSAAPMPRHLHRLVAGIALVLAVCLSAGTVPARSATPALPRSMASLGDSITRGFNACGWYVDCPSRSWTTGSSSSVTSHYLRLLAANSAIYGHNVNDARSGARMSSLVTQAATAVTQHPDYVTILIGANDACTSSESTMTPVATFDAQFRQAMQSLTTGTPNSLVFVASIPNIKRLWNIGKDNFAARTAWSLYGICQSMLARPQSTAQADIDRRSRVKQRVIDYNAALATVCAEYAHCRFDHNAVFDYPFALNQVSTWDYFHPNTSGQAALASVTWANSFWAG
jgi:lysophospholipase L1-like esterase